MSEKMPLATCTASETADPMPLFLTDALERTSASEEDGCDDEQKKRTRQMQMAMTLMVAISIAWIASQLDFSRVCSCGKPTRSSFVFPLARPPARPPAFHVRVPARPLARRFVLHQNEDGLIPEECFLINGMMATVKTEQIVDRYTSALCPELTLRRLAAPFFAQLMAW